MMESTVNTGMCRCCASEGAFKDIQSTYHWMGEEEVYSDMLRECFDIILNVSEQGQDGGICEVCITQLRNAINFKKQVLHTEEQFKKHLQNKTLFRPNIVKLEMPGDEDSDDHMGSGDDGFSGGEFEVPIKTEEDDPKPKKRAAAKASATTTRASAKKAKADNGESSSKRIQETVSKKTQDKKLETAVLVIVEPEKSSELKVKQRRDGKDLEKHRHNVREILRCTNATPIMRRGGVGYMCSYCFQEFPEPSDLKTHTLADHPSKSDPTVGYSRTAPMSEYSVKLDITDLECNECSEQIDTLEELLTHLQQEHNKLIHTDIQNRILPFKFETGEVLTCCLCPDTFDKFKKLQEHMHTHYKNFLCKDCDAGFITLGSLKRHQSIHVKGVFPCSYCPKVYDTSVKKRSHERCNHTHNETINRCGYCNKGFRDYHCKEQHISEVHGVKPPLYKCNACSNLYPSKRRLRIHVKRDHLLERRHKCSVCDMTFFSKHDVTKHMVSHTGEREFQCEICLKSYGRKSTLNSHMRIHNNDRRFKCEHCGMSFVQKCSWKGHMRSKHGEIV